MRILYIHHVGKFGGSSRSLLETINCLKTIDNSINVTLIAPFGQVLRIARKNRITVYPVFGISILDHTMAGFYRGFRWMILFRELFHAIFNILVLLKIKILENEFDIVHINDYYLPISVYFAKKIFKAPVIVHCRSLLETRKGKSRRNFLQYIIDQYADFIIPIDEVVKNSIYTKLPFKIVNNSLKVIDNITSNNNDKIIRFAMIGVLLKYKGVWEFVKAAEILERQGVNAEFVFIGDPVRKTNSVVKFFLSILNLYEDVYTDVLKYIKDKNIKKIKFWGFRENISEIYNSIDIICFPSHLNAPGRPIIEAALFGKPSILAIDIKKSDIFEDMKTTICIKEKDENELAKAMLYLYEQKDIRVKMGQNAKRLAQRKFDIVKNTEIIYKIYKSLI